METFCYNGHDSRKHYYLGQLTAVLRLLYGAMYALEYGGSEGRSYVDAGIASSRVILSGMYAEASHQDLVAVLEDGLQQLATVATGLSDATVTNDEVTKALAWFIKIVIKIGKVTITIEF